MGTEDIIFVIRWWIVLLGIGIVFLPFTSLVFNKFHDKGYIFSKIIGIGMLSYFIFLLGILKLVPFTDIILYISILVFLAINIFIYLKIKKPFNSSFIRLALIEESLFFLSLVAWSYVRGHQPEIHGLEKFMDFGFVNSILRSDYFPPEDMWFAGNSINYYYFGHLITAVLTKISNIKSNIIYNLMIATLFAVSFTSAFSLVLNLLTENILKFKKAIFLGGILGGAFVALSGNLQTIYAFFTSFNPENPLPFWQLPFSFSTFPNAYWYPNATRFIPFTIHEFPLYSFVVADLHGHVLDLLFVILSIALIYSLFTDSHPKLKLLKLILLSLFLSIMYMTNAWDGLIYFLLAVIVIFILDAKPKSAEVNNIKDQTGNSSVHLKTNKEKNINRKENSFQLKIINWKLNIQNLLFHIIIIFLGFIIFSLPFNLNFKPFVSGFGVICAPDFLINLKSLGPFLFEADHCSRSSLWQLVILYGFFYFSVISFILFIGIKKPEIRNSDIFVLILILVSFMLIAAPEFIYAKDIYPAHYRANTMFKLGYQAFIMLSLASAYIFIRILFFSKQKIINIFSIVYILLFIPLFSLIMYYPTFAVNSYYGDLKNYSSLDGLLYLKNLRPYDYDAILWINKNINNQPVFLEAQGDSYTDYERVSANTGLPTILGWTVHEWLWRGTYDYVAPKIEEVKTIYEDTNLENTISLLKKYNVSYVYIGGLEKEKYANLNEEKFGEIGKVVYSNPEVKIYKIQILD